MRASRAIRNAMADERRAPCLCGHSLMQHHEYRSSWVDGGDDFIELPHERYRPGLFACDIEGCDCEVQK